MVAILVAVALLAPAFAGKSLYSFDLSARLSASSARHLLGCDDFGRDILARIVLGSRISLTVGLVSQVVALVIGTALGLAAGFYGGKPDNLIMRCMDVLFSFPSLLLAIALLTIFGPGLWNIILAIGLVSTPAFARLVRGSVLSVKGKEYIEAARAVGMSDSRLIRLHLLPNVVGPVLVYATMGIGDAILSEAGLSFLGLGIQPPTPSWGGMLANGKNFINTSPNEVIFSGLAILLTVVAFNTLGDGIRDRLDPKS
jgi:peptide/nickel transport system permease protein